MLKNLYARLILWLIRPALERYESQQAIERSRVNQIIVSEINRAGPVAEAMERTYGLQRVGR